ncbi:hypothetical protein K7X08_002989 [Anisodus acutangulus]|uniref:RNase H type-1 domain-containing protein n=1 Tax=Anisodus acutangulus TaxID=402998 RepID=A0A9Q1MGL3_9SOLA|nr:hypothetical protein K7X08_002989 [Anisodus acutangulus]
MSPADIIVFKELGLKVLTVDENCKRKAQKPTMFYMPCPYYYLIGNLLGANWSSSCLNQTFLLTNSFLDTYFKLPRCDRNNLETMIRLQTILEFTTEIDIKASEDQMYANLFSGFSWHFFDVDPNFDKPGRYWLDMQSKTFLHCLESDIYKSGSLITDVNAVVRVLKDKLEIEDRKRKYKVQGSPGKPDKNFKEDVPAVAKMTRLKRRRKGHQDVDRWMLYVTRNGVKKLTLDMPDSNTYKLPSCVFYCPTLTQLDLFSFVFTPLNSFLGFQNLKTLHLEGITFEQTTKFCIINAPLLITLDVLDCDGTQYLNIVSPLLELLSVHNIYYLALNYLMNCKKLRELHLGFDKAVDNLEYDERSTLIKLLFNLAPTLERLNLDLFFLEFIKSVPNLSELEITASNGKLCGPSLNILPVHIVSTKNTETANHSVEHFDTGDFSSTYNTENLENEDYLQEAVEAVDEVADQVPIMQQHEEGAKMNFGENMESNVDFHIQDEAERLLKEIEQMTKNVENSKLFLEEDFLEALQINISSREFAEYFGGYRGPRRLRYNEVPPPGWIKLNIYGIGTKGNQPGRYCGIFQDETEIVLDMYTGTIDVEDNVIVGLEALRNGLIRCVEGYPKTQKLIVESDNVILVQYVNRCPEPTEITMSKLKKIFDLLERIPCAIYHVYEEANEVARDWALSLVEFN